MAHKVYFSTGIMIDARKDVRSLKVQNEKRKVKQLP